MSSEDTTDSRLVLEELKLAIRSLSHESDWQDLVQHTVLSELTRKVDKNMCLGAVSHSFPGDAVRVDSVWVKSRKLLFVSADSFHRFLDAHLLYLTTDNDFVTTDNDFTLFYEQEQEACYFTYYNNAIFLYPNVYDVSNTKVIYVTKASVPATDLENFSLSDEFVDLLKLKVASQVATLKNSGSRNSPLVQMLELKYQDAVRTTRQRLNYYPNSQRRSVL